MVKEECSTGTCKAAAGAKKPSLHNMVLAALYSNKTSKGMTMKAIKKAIIDEYPDMQEGFSIKRLQTAVKKGLDSSLIIRPKSSEAEGFAGYFLLNRKQQLAENKKKTAKSDGTDKPKKTKTASSATSEKPKATKTAAKAKTSKDGTTAKPKITKTKSLATKKASTAKKSTKSAPAKTTKKRESMTCSTPKLSKADRTKAGTPKNRRLLK